MLKIQFSKDCHKFLSKLSNQKHLLQIKHKIDLLRIDPFPQDCKALQADLKGKYRVDAGEYRIIYKVDEQEQILKLAIIGKRNDGEVYKKASRK